MGGKKKSKKRSKGPVGHSGQSQRPFRDWTEADIEIIRMQNERLPAIERCFKFVCLTVAFVALCILAGRVLEDEREWREVLLCGFASCFFPLLSFIVVWFLGAQRPGMVKKLIEHLMNAINDKGGS